MAKTSLFANVKSIGTPATAAKGKEKGEVTVKGVQQYAELVALQSAIAAILGTMEAEIKGTAFDLFIETAKETHTSPESFNGVEGIASVNMQMRKRGTNSPLNQSELDVLKTAGL